MLQRRVLNDSAIWKSLQDSRRLTLIAGPCVIESEKLCFEVAASLKKTCAKLGIAFWDYLGSRLAVPNCIDIPSLPTLVRRRCASA